MTNIAETKLIMRFDREKVNIVCIYELELNTSRTDTRQSCLYDIEPNIRRAETRAKNCSRTSNRKEKNTYGIAAAEALDLGSVSSPAMSSRRSWTSGKKASSGK